MISSISFEQYGCLMQMGGNDQWGNMVAGIDLIRRVEGKTTFSMTFPLITTAQGQKMGKTEKGTVWLDAELTSPYEYYQYWINTEDADLERFLALFTFLPMEEISSGQNAERQPVSIWQRQFWPSRRRRSPMARRRLWPPGRPPPRPLVRNRLKGTLPLQHHPPIEKKLWTVRPSRPWKKAERPW